MLRTQSVIGVFADADRPLTAADVLCRDAGETKAGPRSVPSELEGLLHHSERLRSCLRVIDTLIRGASEATPLPQVVQRQASDPAISNLVLSWRCRDGRPVVLSLCRLARRYSDDYKAAAYSSLRPLAVADSSLPSDDQVAPRQRDKLTDRQRQIVDLVSRGLTNAEVARLCGVSKFTIRNHLSKIFEQFGATNRTELATMFLEAEPSSLGTFGAVGERDAGESSGWG